MCLKDHVIDLLRCFLPASPLLPIKFQHHHTFPHISTFTHFHTFSPIPFSHHPPFHTIPALHIKPYSHTHHRHTSHTHLSPIHFHTHIPTLCTFSHLTFTSTLFTLNHAPPLTSFSSFPSFKPLFHPQAFYISSSDIFLMRFSMCGFLFFHTHSLSYPFSSSHFPFSFIFYFFHFKLHLQDLLSFI